MTHRNHHEREFEAFLAGEESELARLYRRLPQTEPDARLDASVLAMARAAVEPQRVNALRHAKTRHRRPWWLVGLSSAAGVVLAAGVAWQMRNAFHEPLPGASSPTAPAAARSERDVIPISAILPPPEPAAAQEPPPAPPAPDAVASAPMPAGGAAGAVVPAKPAPRAASAAAKPKTLAAAADRKDKSVAADTVAAASVAQTAAESAAPAQPELARSATVDAGAAPAAEAGLTADKAAPQAFPGSVPNYNSVERKAAIASGTRRDDYGLSAEAAAADPLAKREQRARATRQIARESAPPRDAAVATEAAPPAAAAAPMAAAAPAAAAATADAEKATELQRNARLAPEEWIKKIRELLRAQRRADALENLALLRRTHPDYALPEDLRELR